MALESGTTTVMMIEKPEQLHHILLPHEFRLKVQQQLALSFADDWESLDKYGMYGAIGALFKLTLHGYGYTFVAKGVQAVDGWRAEKEAHVYELLDDLQGQDVPVCLGTVDLVKTYRLYNGARIAKLLLMSFGGLSLAVVPEEKVTVEVASESARIIREITARGVEHGDIRDYNMLWNATTSKLMAIDFDRAFTFDTKGTKRSRSFGEMEAINKRSHFRNEVVGKMDI
jgi:hypothetical protein